MCLLDTVVIMVNKTEPLASSYFSSYHRNRQTNYQVQGREIVTKGLVKVALVAYIMDVILGTLGEV